MGTDRRRAEAGRPGQPLFFSCSEMLVHSILDVCRGLTMAARFGGSGMDMLTSNSALLLEKSVGFLWTKQAAILDNIANAETPNYKTKVVTFEESIRSRLEQAAASPGEA